MKAGVVLLPLVHPSVQLSSLQSAVKHCQSRGSLARLLVTEQLWKDSICLPVLGVSGTETWPNGIVQGDQRRAGHRCRADGAEMHILVGMCPCQAALPALLLSLPWVPTRPGSPVAPSEMQGGV